MSERERIDFLLRRDGPQMAVKWVTNTMRIYRSAVLNKRHFASTGEYRRKFIEAYCEFKHWLAAFPGVKRKSL
ncbi:MAG: hypothetical protein ACREA9_13440 [Pyrinomonadaceae bacterium]